MEAMEKLKRPGRTVRALAGSVIVLGAAAAAQHSVSSIQGANPFTDPSFRTLRLDPCPLAPDSQLSFTDSSFSGGVGGLEHPTKGAINADNTAFLTQSGAVLDLSTGQQVGFHGTGGGASNAQWANTESDKVYYVHSDGSFRVQRVMGGFQETTLFTPAQLGYVDVIAGPSEGLILSNDDTIGLFMGRVSANSTAAELFLWDLGTSSKRPGVRPVTWGAHDFISLSHRGQYAIVKSVPGGASNGPWWFYPVQAQGLGARVVSQFPFSHHAGPATDGAHDRWVDAAGRVFNMRTGRTLRILCGFWSLGQHVHGVRGLDAVVGSVNGRASLVLVDGSGAMDLGPMGSQGETYVQLTRYRGQGFRALFQRGASLVARTY